jgi:hypothetical protein
LPRLRRQLRVPRGLQSNREGHSGLVESVGINIDERGSDDHRSLVPTRERGRCFRAKHEATAKTNATGWYSLTAKELHAGAFKFLTKYQGSATYAPSTATRHTTVTVS